MTHSSKPLQCLGALATLSGMVVLAAMVFRAPPLLIMVAGAMAMLSGSMMIQQALRAHRSMARMERRLKHLDDTVDLVLHGDEADCATPANLGYIERLRQSKLYTALTASQQELPVLQLTATQPDMRVISAQLDELRQEAEQLQSLSRRLLVKAAEPVGQGATLADWSLDDLAAQAADAASRMREAMQRTGHSAEALRNLQKTSDTINHIATTIRQLATQSSLLALNAAIAAGQGSGQALSQLAADARELSQETRGATDTIAGHLDAIRADMELALSAAESANRVVQQAGQGMGGLQRVAETWQPPKEPAHSILDDAQEAREAADRLHAQAARLDAHLKSWSNA